MARVYPSVQVNFQMARIAAAIRADLARNDPPAVEQASRDDGITRPAAVHAAGRFSSE